MDSVVLTVLREPRTCAPANGPAQNIADPVGGVPAEGGGLAQRALRNDADRQQSAQKGSTGQSTLDTPTHGDTDSQFGNERIGGTANRGDPNRPVTPVMAHLAESLH
jgi:hypothetical protein